MVFRHGALLVVAALALAGCAEEVVLARGGDDCSYREQGDNGEFRATATLECDGDIGRAVVGPIDCQDLEVWLGYDLGSPVHLRLFRGGHAIESGHVEGSHADGAWPTWEAHGEGSYQVKVDPASGASGSLVVGLVCDD